ncbi:GntR family transcriptional regulator [Celeribacter sp. ULVN23_4]
MASEKSAARSTKIKKLSASQQIHAALRERIIALDLTPGEYLSRAEIADYYGVSQTPVRDAMMRLEEEGLLFIFPQSKTEVSKIDIGQAQETQFLRMSLEIEVARRLITANNPALLRSAKTALHQQRIAHENGDLALFAEYDRAFHRALFAACEVSALWDLVVERSGHIDRLRKLNLPDPGKVFEILSYHAKILSAIESRDAAKAEAEVREHLSGTLARIDAIIARHPEYF